MSNVLGGRDLHDTHEAEIFVHLHDGALCGKRKRHMRIALPVPVKRGGLPMMVDAGLLDRLVKGIDQRADTAGARQKFPRPQGPRGVRGPPARPGPPPGAPPKGSTAPPPPPLPPRPPDPPPP